MKKLRSGDHSGVETPAEAFRSRRGEVIEGNPRTEQKYRDDCVKICGLSAEEFDKERYGHLEEGDLDLLRWVVK